MPHTVPYAVKSEWRLGRSALNYLGQLRLYSYADLVLLLLAVGATTRELGQCSLLWFGFLIHLEWRHRDRGRLTWPWQVWAVAWLVAAELDLSPRLLPFFAMALIYANKKHIRFISLISPLVNGAIKGSLALLVTQAPWQAIVLVTVLTAGRNLAGDFRDIMKDRHENVGTIPVRLGIRHDMRRLYPLGLAATSLFWVYWGKLPASYLLVALLVQASTYRLTPR